MQQLPSTLTSPINIPESCYDLLEKFEQTPGSVLDEAELAADIDTDAMLICVATGMIRPSRRTVVDRQRRGPDGRWPRTNTKTFTFTDRGVLAVALYREQRRASPTPASTAPSTSSTAPAGHVEPAHKKAYELCIQARTLDSSVKTDTAAYEWLTARAEYSEQLQSNGKPMSRETFKRYVSAARRQLEGRRPRPNADGSASIAPRGLLD